MERVVTNGEEVWNGEKEREKRWEDSSFSSLSPSPSLFSLLLVLVDCSCQFIARSCGVRRVCRVEQILVFLHFGLFNK